MDTQKLRDLVASSTESELVDKAVFFADQLACISNDPADIHLYVKTLYNAHQYRRAVLALKSYGLLPTDVPDLDLNDLQEDERFFFPLDGDDDPQGQRQQQQQQQAQSGGAADADLNLSSVSSFSTASGATPAPGASRPHTRSQSHTPSLASTPLSRIALVAKSARGESQAAQGAGGGLLSSSSSNPNGLFSRGASPSLLSSSRSGGAASKKRLSLTSSSSAGAHRAQHQQRRKIAFDANSIDVQRCKYIGALCAAKLGVWVECLAYLGTGFCFLARDEPENDPTRANCENQSSSAALTTASPCHGSKKSRAPPAVRYSKNVNPLTPSQPRSPKLKIQRKESADDIAAMSDSSATEESDCSMSTPAAAAAVSPSTPAQSADDVFAIPTPRVRPLREKSQRRKGGGGAARNVGGNKGRDSVRSRAREQEISATVSAMCLLRGKCFEALERRAHAQRWYLRALQTDVTNVEAFSCLVDSRMLKSYEEKTMFEMLKFSDDTAWLKPFYQAKLQHHGLKAEDIDKLSSEQSKNVSQPSPSSGLARNIDLLTCKARNYFKRSEFRKCYDITKRIMQDDPFLHPVLTVHISVMKHLKLTSELFYCAHKLVDTSPDSAVTWFAVGTYYLLVENFEHARQYFNKATDIDPNFGDAWVGLGNSFSGLKESDQAMTAYRAAHRIMPGSHLPPLHVAIEYNRIKNPRNALIFLEEARQAYDYDPRIESEIGMACFEKNEFQFAVAHFENALKYAENHPPEEWAHTAFKLGNALHFLGKYHEAIRVYNRALVSSKKKATVHLHIGLSYHALEDWDRAIECFHKALALQPDDNLTKEALARAMKAASQLPFDP